MPIAFKEWAVTVRALAEGEQLITLRKGGIREPGKPFRLAHERFFLYPTFDHQPGDLVRESHQPELRRALEEGVWSDGEPPLHAFASGAPVQQPDRVRIRAWAEVAGHFTIADPRCVDALSPFYVWTPDYAEKRLGWRRHQPLHVLLLRTYRIPRPVTVKVKDEYTGSAGLGRAAARTALRGHAGALRRRVRARLRGDPRDHARSRPARPGLGRRSHASASRAACGAGLGHEHVARAGGEEVRHVEARGAAQHAGDPLLEQQPLDELRLGLVLGAGDLHELPLGVLRLDLARLALALRWPRRSGPGTCTSGMPQASQKRSRRGYVRAQPGQTSGSSLTSPSPRWPPL